MAEPDSQKSVSTPSEAEATATAVPEAQSQGMLTSLWRYFTASPTPPSPSETSPPPSQQPSAQSLSLLNTASTVEAVTPLQSPKASEDLGKTSRPTSSENHFTSTPQKQAAAARRPLTPGRIQVVRTSSTTSPPSLSPRYSLESDSSTIATHAHLPTASYVAAYTPARLSPTVSKNDIPISIEARSDHGSSGYSVVFPPAYRDASSSSAPMASAKESFLESLNSLPSTLKATSEPPPIKTPPPSPSVASKNSSLSMPAHELYLYDHITKNNISLDAREQKFQRLLSDPHVAITDLKKLAWNGVPTLFRPLTWQLLLGYAPLVRERRASTIAFKREKYWESARQFFDLADGDRPDYERGIYHQISIDVPRTHPGITLFHLKDIQRRLHRILYVWAIRHPASGYVQGINELVTPFLAVFLRSHIHCDTESEEVNAGIESLSATVLDEVEADAYGCMNVFIDSIQDNFTVEQPGIQRMLFRLQEIVQKIDPALEAHLTANNIPFVQFAFRWMNCLLMREIPLRLVYRVWDTYLAEGEIFGTFHIYVCAAFLIHWSDELKKMDFQEIILHLQHLPTSEWGDKEIETFISQAFVWMTVYNDSKAHFAARNGGAANTPKS